MVDIQIEGEKYQIDPDKNLISALEDINIHVPHFCYHPKLSIVGMCRMCLIEVEGNPKLQPACNTIIQEGMSIHVSSEKVLKAREGVMEFLLINHPLDCPVCDKSGECSLQDYSYTAGKPTTRYQEKKREIPQEKLGSNLYINHDRCILCYRCVRFDDEILGKHDLEFSERGSNTIIQYSKPNKDSSETLLDHNYQGALADICPVGALLNENTLFSSRVWWYKQNQSICHGCATLCPVTVNEKNNEIYRYMPPEDAEKNGYFLCDHGRFSATEFSKDRLFSYMSNGANSVSYRVMQELYDYLKKCTELVWLGGTTESNEEIEALLRLRSDLERESMFQLKKIAWEYRTQDYMWEDQWEQKKDFLMSVDTRPNSSFLRDKLSLAFQDTKEMISTCKNADLLFIFNEFSSPYSYLSTEPELLYQNMLFSMIEDNQWWNKVVVFSTHFNEATERAFLSIPIQAFVEKNTSFTDREGRVKTAHASIHPPQGLHNIVHNVQYILNLCSIPTMSSSNKDSDQNSNGN